MLKQINYLFKFKFLIVLPALLFLLNSSVLSDWAPAGTLTDIGEDAVISVVNTNVVWIAGGTIANPVVYRTTNGGTTWINVSTTELGNFPLSAVYGIDENTAYVGNGGDINYGQGNASFYKTTNGGLNWTLMGSTGGAYGFINGIAFSKLNPSFGVVQSAPQNGPGTPFWLSVTTDGGVTWTVNSTPGVNGAQGFKQTLNVIDEDFYCFGLSGTIPQTGLIKTTNGGQNWSSVTNILGGQFTSGLAFSSNKLNGIITSHVNYNIARTTDGGITWSAGNFGGSMSGYLISRFVHNTNVCFIASQNVNSSVKIKMSTDAGQTWNPTTTPGASGISSMDFVNTSDGIAGYAFSFNGNVIKFTETLTSVKGKNTEQPEGFVLHQNYPNPFNPNTKIKFTLYQSASVKIRIFDISGREVLTLVDDHMNAGVYENTFNASNLSSGIYFYTLYINNEAADTKKMIVGK